MIQVENILILPELPLIDEDTEVESLDMALVQYDYHEEVEDEELHHLPREEHEQPDEIMVVHEELQQITTQVEVEEQEQLDETEQATYLETEE